MPTPEELKKTAEEIHLASARAIKNGNYSLTYGIERIAEERQRQISVEGWTPEHDDEHRNGELAIASACYAACAQQLAARQERGENVPMGDFTLMLVPNHWPWYACWWRPSNSPARNLEKAGALAAAEIDRLERLKVREGKAVQW